MTDYQLIDLLGRALAHGKVGNLAEFLSDDCEYESDYAHIKINTSKVIINRMKYIYSNLKKEDAYTYKSVRIEEVLRNPDGDWFLCDGGRMNSYGLLLYQYNAEYPVAVVLEKLNREGQITKIWLTRDKELCNVDFYMEEVWEDSPNDLPSTVAPLTPHDRNVQEMRDAFSGQHLDHRPKEIDGEIFIWQKADEYIKKWLPREGYSVRESRIFDDCIGYRCIRNGFAYTVYMFAFGKNKTLTLDGEYCRKLSELDFSSDSTVLVVYLQAGKYKTGDKIEYKVFFHTGNAKDNPELWKVSCVNGKHILVFYPRKEIFEAVCRLMYAFNRVSLDAYDCIVCSDNPSVQLLEYPGSFMNRGFFMTLERLHEQYGDMKIGFVRYNTYNEAIYCFVPYLEGYGYFSVRVDGSNRITDVTAYPFEGGKRKVLEFLKTDEKEEDFWFSDIPALIAVEALPPVPSERFALKLIYENWECRKYVLPILKKDAEDEVISFRQHVFTDKIWASASIEDHLEPEIGGYAERGSAVVFKNGFFISGFQCYRESTPYSEPVICDDVVYQDDNLKVKRIWQWEVNALYFDDNEPDLVKTLISGSAFNFYGKSTFVTKEGKRLCSIDFDDIDSFSEGLARVIKDGDGYGYVNKKMEFVIPMRYEDAEDFRDGKAKVKYDGKWMFIDKTGNELEVGTGRYQEVGDFSEGMCKVSTLKLRMLDFAYHLDWDQIAGCWGFVNEAGEEVIPPQYIGAEDFENGIAIVCKGEWTIDPKWNNKYSKDRFWSEEMLWGAIDKAGNTVIPFVFDEIKHFYSADEDNVRGIFMAHYGGWEDGHWGVIDDHGNWLADPVFEDIGYECSGDMIIFYDRDSWDDDALLGLYNFREKKVVFEPQFHDIEFVKDGLIQVEVNDEELGRHVEKLIDLSGKEKFHSVYSSMQTWRNPPWHVRIRDKDGDKIGLIDENGKVLVPCQNDIVWDGILHDQKRIVFKKGDKKGIRDFEGNVIIPAEYDEIHRSDQSLIVVRKGKNVNFKEGIFTSDGREVVPVEYKYVIVQKDGYIVCCREGYCEMLKYETKQKKE